MSASEENTEIATPCVLVTSCDSEFKEEELIKRKLRWNKHNSKEANVKQS